MRRHHRRALSFYVPPPPVRVGVVIGPGYGYYGPRYGFYGSRRFYGRHAYWARAPSSLALTKICVEAAVSAAGEAMARLNDSPAPLLF